MIIGSGYRRKPGRLYLTYARVFMLPCLFFIFSYKGTGVKSGPALLQGVVMVEFADILTLLGSYCFPIVMCVAFFWKIDRDQRQHKEEMDKMTDALHNNTLAIQHLVDIVTRDKGGVTNVSGL